MHNLTQHWLTILCRTIKGATRAVIYMTDPETNSFQATSFWPEEQTDHQSLIPCIKKALSEKKCLLQEHSSMQEETGEPFDIISCPLILSDRIVGAVAVEMYSGIASQQQRSVQQIENASFWLKVIADQQASAAKEQLVTIIEMVATGLEHHHFQEAATDVTTDLATRLACDRVSIGFMHDRNVRVEAVSHSTNFDRRTALIRDIGEAMHESMDQEQTILYPTNKENVLITRNHALFCETHHTGNLCTIPFVKDNAVIGALMFERVSEKPFDEETVEQCQQIASLLGPVLDIRRRDEQWLGRKIYEPVRAQLVKLFGPGHIAWKCGLCGAAACLLFISLVNGDYRVSATAHIEARTQRVVVAPQDGYIATSSVRPGDIVRTDQVLGMLDDKDLMLSYQKWSGQREQLRKEYREALANHDRSSVNIINARLEQAEAQLSLAGEQLARTRLLAPFDGLIVSGDLSQSLGSPVTRGQVLFNVAPLDAYRVILEVDERDIGEIKADQQGHLVLSSMPKELLPIDVEKITPVSTTREKRNFFRVEASMELHSDLLRPGMEGVAKVDIERRRLIWIWTHRMIDWMRLASWAWRP